VDGRPYRNARVVVDLRDGRARRWREDVNPLAVEDAFAPADP
jgi:ketosteroid isomerase-like protein